MATVIDINTPASASSAERYVDLSDIVGGALVATAISLILFAFGSALGLSFASAEPGEGASLRWLAIGGGLWLVWQAVTSAAAGAYFAGRMRKPVGDVDADEIETRDGAHGIAVWALATVLTALLAAAGVGGAAKAVGAAVGGAGDAVANVISDNADYLAGVALRNANRLPSRESRAEIASVLTRSLTDGEVTEPDRAYLAGILATESSLTQAEARARIDEIIGTAERARDKAIDAAEQARMFMLIGAFIVAASLFVSGAAAYFAAVLGGKHRNDSIGFSQFGRPPRQRA